MTRDEHTRIINEHRAAQKELFNQSMALYNKHIKPLEMNRTDAECRIAECRYMGDVDKIAELEVEIDEYTRDIKSLEISTGLADLVDEGDRMEEVLATMQENARLELGDYEYWTSSIPDVLDRGLYFADYGLVCSTIFRMFDVITVNNLNTKFKQDEHIPFLEGISPFMPTNQVIDGMDVVHYVLEMNTDCTIAYNKEKTIWYLLMEDDVVFESENLIDIFEYRNIVG